MSKNEMDKAIEEMGAEQPLQTEPAAERPADGTVKAKPASPKAVKMVKCVINSSEGTEGANDVFVSLNGVAYQIRRDVEVLQIARTCIAIVDVISVFPDINGQQRSRIGGQRSTRVRG